MRDRATKRTLNKRALLAVFLTASICWGFTFLSTNIFKAYSWGLFIWLPIVLGASATLIYGYNNNKSRSSLSNISMLTLGVYGVGLLLFSIEGLICLIMVAPLGLVLTWVGHIIAHRILQSKQGNPSAVVILLFISVPFIMSFESRFADEENLRSVVTSIEIEASPEEVWKNVIAFPKLKEPTEFIFKTGIAYPIDATINGSGVGAVRYCNFSTGSFVEPITVWDEPHLLKFTVEEQPEPMKEISLYDLHPAHLNGYWVSRQGQFKLIRLPNGNTLLEGTTWYVNKIKPDFYWTLWSDYIVHQIHKRVLDHIKQQSEQ